MGLSTILVTFSSTYTSLVVYIVFYGLSDGFFFTSLSVILITASPLKTTAVLGWEMTLTSIFLASGPPLGGKITVVMHIYTLSWHNGGVVGRVQSGSRGGFRRAMGQKQGSNRNASANINPEWHLG